jgi:putative flippase GtrA
VRPAGAVREAAGFALAGIAAYGTDLAVFVWLRGSAGLGPITAKALSFLAGCAVAYAGNALGTYRGRAAASSRARRYGVFFAVNLAGALVQLACLGVSHYLLGLTSPRQDVVSWAGVGMVLATCLRFWGTRTLVFGPARGGPGGGAAGPGGRGRAADPSGRRRASGDGGGEGAVAGLVGGTEGHPGGEGPGGPGVRGAEEGNHPTWTG